MPQPIQDGRPSYLDEWHPVSSTDTLDGPPQLLCVEVQSGLAGSPLDHGVRGLLPRLRRAGAAESRSDVRAPHESGAASLLATVSHDFDGAACGSRLPVV
jgi:hypothetical protein